MLGFIRLLQFAGLLGMGLSHAGMAFAVYFRIDFVLKQAPAGGGPETGGGMLQILDAFREPGKTFLLSALLFVVCEIAVRAIPQTPRPTDPDGGYNSPP